MSGNAVESRGAEVVLPHRESRVHLRAGVQPRGRLFREEAEEHFLSDGATRARGAGHRVREELPDSERTCFERDRDRIVHSTSFRRLAGKTQVVVFPTDHQRTRLTHALEVSQVATAIARGVGANVSLTSAIALGHDCGHGPGGHASEEAFDAFLPEGFDHGPWGAHVALADLNLCVETLDGIANHSWSSPAPFTVEGEIVSWADRIAYCAHDLEDAIRARIVTPDDLPEEVTDHLGVPQREQLGALIRAVIQTSCDTGIIGMDETTAGALAALRRFNYERIYTRQESLEQSRTMVRMLHELVSFYFAHPEELPSDHRDESDAIRGVVTYVAGMTDRFAFESAERLLGWEQDSLPVGIGHGA
ncbi:HD domain-containing protein [Propionibacterium sp.]|uniref:HD domain-containing protein n=1 Tax=Propionibacterium sp. TaxID=1977903 RepID=UPI0039EA2E46